MLALDLGLGRRDSRYTGSADPYGGAMVLEIDTALGVGDSFAMSYGAGTYDAVITYPDDSTQQLVGVLAAGSINKVFGGPTVGNVSITGTFPHPFFNNGGDKLKLNRILNIGNTGIKSLFMAFYGCSNLLSNTSFTANVSGITDANGLSGTFRNCFKLITNDLSVWSSLSVDLSLNEFMSACFVLVGEVYMGWYTGRPTSLFRFMFNNTNQQAYANMSHLDISVCNEFNDIFGLSTVPTAIYDLITTAWAPQTFKPGLATCDFGSSAYSAAATAARNTAAANFVTYLDGGLAP